MEYAGGSDPAFPGLDQVNIVNETLGGASVTGTVALNGVARAGGFPVSLRSSVPTVTAPAMVTVPQGQAAANFTISTPTTAASQSATIIAQANSVTLTATLEIDPTNLPQLDSFAVSPTGVEGGASFTETVGLSGLGPLDGRPTSPCPPCYTRTSPHGVTTRTDPRRS